MNLSNVLNDPSDPPKPPTRSPSQQRDSTVARSGSIHDGHPHPYTSDRGQIRESSQAPRPGQGPGSGPKYEDAHFYAAQQASQSPAALYNATQYSPKSLRHTPLPGPLPVGQQYLSQPLTPSQYTNRGVGYPQNNPAHLASPTPSSHRSHTPGSVHQSPQTGAHQLPYGQQAFHAAQRTSQSNMPPPLQRSSTHGSYAESPLQTNSYSGIAQHTGSPPVHPTALRQTSDHITYERGNSMSVSPKTKTIPAVSRASSRSSIQGDSAPHQSMQSSPQQRAGYHENINTNSPSDNLRTTPQLAKKPFRRASTMDLANMLTPVEDNSKRDYFPPSASPARKLADHANKPAKPDATDKTIKEEEKETPEVNGQVDSAHSADSRPDLKRGAEGELDSAPPVKRGRMRKYSKPPIWAQLSSHNPRYEGPGMAGTQRPQAQQIRRAETPDKNMHGTPNGLVNVEQPWMNSMPIDSDLLSARNVLGAWEKSIRWNTPYPDTLRAVQDWLVNHLQDHQDILKDPSLGSIEIEAKIGRLHRQASGERAALPVLNMVVLNPSVNRDYFFESELEQNDFMVLNKFLNESLVASRQLGRIPMVHQRVQETDSFSHLSKGILDLLPKSILRQAQGGRDLKMRTTHSTKAGRNSKPTAQIVKVHLADLHIYNPTGYDCRITMNAEINLMRPGLDSNDITTPASEKNPVPQSREKDRISYRHLAYQIDLTTVHVQGLSSKFEMEVEVDARQIDQQIKLMSEGKPHAFGDVVSGFMDNVTFLMRQQ